MLLLKVDSHNTCLNRSYHVLWFLNLNHSISQGCDCLGYIKYFDAHFTNFTGGVETIENCVCLHEEDHGILWKHQDWRTGLAEVRRSRRLTVSFICTVANYEYGFFWHFYQASVKPLKRALFQVFYFLHCYFSSRYPLIYLVFRRIRFCRNLTLITVILVLYKMNSLNISGFYLIR